MEGVRQTQPAATSPVTTTTIATAKPTTFTTPASAQRLTPPNTSAAAASIVNSDIVAKPTYVKQPVAEIEPEIHGLQGVSVFKEETSSPPPPSVASPSISASAALSSPTASSSTDSKVQSQGQKRKFVPRERAVPSNSVSRALGFAGLGASLLLGTAKDSIGRAWRGSGNNGNTSSIQPDGTGDSNSTAVYSSFLSESNAERLAEALCRMRGAALKLGQMLSIQDENVMPPQFQAALERVRAGADVMPRRQLEKVLNSELGSEWRERVQEFDDQPLAAASIGQVHGADVLL